MELRPGLLVGKNVRLLRPLGEGGMGSVWVAEHLTLQTEVAVKLVLSQLSKDEQTVKRFTTEATAAAQIKSPHVVQVFDHGIWNGLPYIVMELLEGEDLEGRIARLGKIPLEDMAVILKQCSKALMQAHTLGIVHRDIKPANIYLIAQGDGEIFVKLLDFGIAKRTAGENFAKTATGALIGTPFYMSPEQVMEDRMIDFHADLWALSVVAYEGLTGKVPFNGASLGAICVAVNSCVYAPASQLNPALPPDVDRWFARAFARDPNQRFGSVKDMADAMIAIAQATGWEGIAGQTGRIHIRASFPLGFPQQGSMVDPRRSGTPLPGAVPVVPAPPPSYSGAMQGGPPPPRPSSSGTSSGTSWPGMPVPSLTPPPSSALPHRGSRTDPLPQHTDAAMQKMTLSGTTMSDVDPARRKRRVAVAIVGGALVACVVLGLVIALAMRGAAVKDPDPSPAAHPEESSSAGAALLPSAPPSSQPSVEPAAAQPSATESAAGAASSLPSETSSSLPPKPLSTGASTSKSGSGLRPPLKNPPRRNHGF